MDDNTARVLTILITATGTLAGIVVGFVIAALVYRRYE